MRQTVRQSLVQCVFSAAMLAALLTTIPGIFGQHPTGGHVGLFNGGSVDGSFSTPFSFGRFRGQTPRSLGAPRG